jgi:hypothetical protein
MMLLKSACNSTPRRTNLTGVGRGSSIEEISRRHIDKKSSAYLSLHGHLRGIDRMNQVFTLV